MCVLFFAVSLDVCARMYASSARDRDGSQAHGMSSLVLFAGCFAVELSDRSLTLSNVATSYYCGPNKCFGCRPRRASNMRPLEHCACLSMVAFVWGTVAPVLVPYDDLCGLCPARTDHKSPLSFWTQVTERPSKPFICLLGKPPALTKANVLMRKRHAFLKLRLLLNSGLCCC